MNKIAVWFHNFPRYMEIKSLMMHDPQAARELSKQPGYKFMRRGELLAWSIFWLFICLLGYL